MYDHDFMDFAASESAQLNSDASWMAWIDRAEAILGHDLDGDNSAPAKAQGRSDGFSLDDAYDAFLDGITPTAYAAAVKSDPAYRGGIRWIDEAAA